MPSAARCFAWAGPTRRKELSAFEQAQAKAMDEQRRQFRDNQQKIDDVLKTR